MTSTSTPARPEGAPASTGAEELAAQVLLLGHQVAELQQMAADRTGRPGGGGQAPAYGTVEDWVRDYLLPTFPRAVGEVGLVRWHWCEQWWRHDEAVTRLTALWYGWEHARLEMTGMLGWLRELDHHLPTVLGPDGPFRGCSPAAEGVRARHQLLPVAPVTAAPPDWWDWWSDAE